MCHFGTVTRKVYPTIAGACARTFKFLVDGANATVTNFFTMEIWRPFPPPLTIFIETTAVGIISVNWATQKPFPLCLIVQINNTNFFKMSKDQIFGCI